MKRVKSRTKIGIIILSLVIGLGLLAGCSSKEKPKESAKEESSTTKKTTLLNVSYDPTRELYGEYNEAFKKYWKDKKGEEIEIKQSHGGSGKQGRAVVDGLEADVVTLALAYDIDSINKKKELIKKDWQKSLENNSSPYTSTIVFLVKKDNPKKIKDWDDLVKDGVEVITPNPKTSGGARWNYLAAYGYALEKNNNDENKAKDFVKRLFANVPVLDSGARGSTTTFVERGVGDVLIAWENEAYLVEKEMGKGKFDIVVPSLSILAEPPVAVVDNTVDKKGTREVATEYLRYLYSDEGQEIAAKNFYRPTNKEIAKKYEKQFPQIKLITIDGVFGGWNSAQKKHFDDGGVFDEIYTKK